jgi:hypothetical protein
VADTGLPWELPYPLPTDLVRDGADAIKDLAEATATGLDAALFTYNVAENFVAASQSTTSTAYTDLATVGPSVTLTTGTKALIIIRSALFNNATSASLVGVSITGATTVAAADPASLFTNLPGGHQVRMGVSYIFTSLTAGSNTFTLKYRVTGGTGTFEFRGISVIDLGS